MHDVVAMVTKRDLVGAEFLGGTIDDAATQARTQRTGRLALRDLALDDRIGVLLDDAVLDTDLRQISGSTSAGKPGCFWSRFMAIKRKSTGARLRKAISSDSRVYESLPPEMQTRTVSPSSIML
jgi:hypothetical protein